MEGAQKPRKFSGTRSKHCAFSAFALKTCCVRNLLLRAPPFLQHSFTVRVTPRKLPHIICIFVCGSSNNNPRQKSKTTRTRTRTTTTTGFMALSPPAQGLFMFFTRRYENQFCWFVCATCTFLGQPSAEASLPPQDFRHLLTPVQAQDTHVSAPLPRIRIGPKKRVAAVGFFATELGLELLREDHILSNICVPPNRFLPFNIMSPFW